MRRSLQQEIAYEALQYQTRRHFLSRCTTGLGATWLASQAVHANDAIGQAAVGKLPAKVKHVIFLHMVGAPSQLELYDYRPELQKYNGQDCPQSYLEGQRFAFIKGVPKLLGPQYPFKQHGQSGAWLSDRLPNFSEVVDKVCFIKTMQTDQFNHGPAELMVHCGQPRVGYPGIGSWVTWGLGTDNNDLPGYIVLLSGGRPPRVGNALWSNGFLPSIYQGVQCRAQGDPILNVANPDGVSATDRRAVLDTLKQLNQMNYDSFGDPETLTRISQYEMAFRMQTAVPEAMDIKQEPQNIHDLYGTKPGETSFANNCLLARRLVERGVRYIQLFDWGWDSHGADKNEALNHGFKDKCADIDRPMTALIKDLDQRGMLQDTLVIWGGEFGRTSMAENRGGKTMQNIGRDHNPNAFTFWMAGAGIKPGISYGETDEMGYKPADKPVLLRDFHATLLHLMGIDYQNYSFPFQGLNQKLTGVKPASVVKDILT